MNMKKTLLNLVPSPFRLPLRYYYYKSRKMLDFEISIIPGLISKCGHAIDIGANVGIYTYLLAKHCQHVEAFEPIPACADAIRSYNGNNINVHNVALSNKKGTASLYIPVVGDKQNTGHASIRNMTGKITAITVTLHTLDEYNFRDVSFIKIDVEGHELHVLEGAIDTIKREKPILFVEIEQRHLNEKRIADVFQFILNLGYEGGFYFQRCFYPIQTFSYEKHQKPFLDNVLSDSYVNNFIFTPIR